jgi:restriction endonuclease Mrr
MSTSADREEQLVILLALQILEDLGRPSPKKRMVISFIQNREFTKFYDTDFDKRSNGEFVWENDFAWAREDLKRKRRLEMPENGVWRITEEGKNVLRDRAKHYLTKFTEDPTIKEKFLAISNRITPTFFDTMIAYAKGEDVTQAKKSIKD